MAFKVLNAVWDSTIDLSIREQCVVARLACLTRAPEERKPHRDDGLAFRSLNDLALDTKASKRGLLDILNRLTDKASSKYCVDIVELGEWHRASRYRVRVDRLGSRSAAARLFGEAAAVSGEAAAVSGAVTSPDPLIPPSFSIPSGAGAPPQRNTINGTKKKTAKAGARVVTIPPGERAAYQRRNLGL